LITATHDEVEASPHTLKLLVIERLPVVVIDATESAVDFLVDVEVSAAILCTRPAAAGAELKKPCVVARTFGVYVPFLATLASAADDVLRAADRDADAPRSLVFDASYGNALREVSGDFGDVCHILPHHLSHGLLAGSVQAGGRVFADLGGGAKEFVD
jgi:hypothetical protein